MSKRFLNSENSQSHPSKISNSDGLQVTIHGTIELSMCEKENLFELWNDEFPASIGYSEFSDFDDEFIGNISSPRYFLLRDNKSKKILGFYVDFLRGKDRWFVMLLGKKIQRKGFGSLLLKHAQTDIDSLYGWVIDQDTYLKANGEKYFAPVAFYKKNGFDISHDIKSSRNGIETVRMVWKKSDD